MAIREHYMPRSTHDEVPESSAGVALALAEKIDHLVACFAIDQRPSGSADPYGLRRAAIGLIRIVNENALRLSLRQDCSQALALLPPECRGRTETVPAVLDFIRDRLFQMCVDSKVPHDLVRALLAAGYDDLTDFRHRMEAMMKCSKLPTWPSLVTIVERTFNISKAHPADDKGETDVALLKEPEEKALWKVWTEDQPAIAKLIEMGKYEQAAVAYNRIFAGPVHAFFEKVFVNVEDAALKANRMRMLRSIHRLFAERIADLAQIQLGATIGAAGTGKKAAEKPGGEELTALGKD
ncbi:MAG: glycine--tRNA ligase subunit beta [Planctomycetes bacterium]|nr:glycine--tRNA ligase subunit beta [Planctomycetota bacterium]